MSTSPGNTITHSAEQFGVNWNRFWFAPSDPIVLSVVRIATGLLALYWQLCYTPDLVEFFGLNAIMPLEMLRQWRGNAMVFSYFDEQLAAGPLLALHFSGSLVLLLFTLGVFTRVTSILALLVTLSYIHRGPMLTAQLEPVLAFVQFYLCLGPSGAALSWDAWRRRRQAPQSGIANGDPRSSWATVAVRLLQVHLTAVYVMMALAKVSSPAWWNGSAIWWLVARPESQGFALAGWLAPHLNLIEAWTHVTLLFELSFPLLVWNRLTRPWVLLLAVPMWLLLALATGLNTFALIMLAANLAFVSPTVFRGLLKWVGGRRAALSSASSASSERVAAPGGTLRTKFAAARR